MPICRDAIQHSPTILVGRGPTWLRDSAPSLLRAATTKIPSPKPYHGRTLDGKTASGLKFSKGRLRAKPASGTSLACIWSRNSTASPRYASSSDQNVLFLARATRLGNILNSTIAAFMKPSKISDSTLTFCSRNGIGVMSSSSEACFVSDRRIKIVPEASCLTSRPGSLPSKDRRGGRNVADATRQSHSLSACEGVTGGECGR